MIVTTGSTPGLRFTVAAEPQPQSPLRTDIAGFMGRTRRGPVGRLVRVEGERQYLAMFGGLRRDLETPYAIHGYFANGGQVAHVLRLASAGSRVASATWPTTAVDPCQAEPQKRISLPIGRFELRASSPGVWANGMTVSIEFYLRGVSGEPELSLSIRADQEPVEYLSGLLLKNLQTEVASRSHLIELRCLQPTSDALLKMGSSSSKASLPQYLRWAVTLNGGSDGTSPEPNRESYLLGVQTLCDEPEIALVAAPDLVSDLYRSRSANGSTDDAYVEVVQKLVGTAEELHDRLVLLDVPPSLNPQKAGLCDIECWLRRFGTPSGKDDAESQSNSCGCPGASPSDLSTAAWRAAATYYPSMYIVDPLGTPAQPVRVISPSGHMAGVISRLDRERGVHHTPANVPIEDAVDLEWECDDKTDQLIRKHGINILRCIPGRGIYVWGGRTLYDPEQTSYVAHRRLIHRLVRAIRRVADPLVFDTNGPELWLTLVRAITTVLLSAYRAGALQGTRPDEAFRVRCDTHTNPPEEIDRGRCRCEVEIAPAAPMEFILLRIALSKDGTLELLES